MTATANGKPLLSAEIYEPRVGTWSAVVDIDGGLSSPSATGAMTLQIEGQSWSGYAVRGDVYIDHVHATIVGGRGALETQLPAKYYVSVSLGTIIDDVMSVTGELLSSTADKALLSLRVDRFTRAKGSAAQTMWRIAQEAGGSWRVLRDGSIWIGYDDWPSVTLKDTVIVERSPSDNALTLAPLTPVLGPGVILDDSRGVSVVITRCVPEELRQTLLFEDDVIGSGGAETVHGRLADDFAAIIETFVGTRIDYSRLYPAKVVKQADDGSLELIADSDVMRGTGLTRVPIRHGLPGVSCWVNAGSRVGLFFENGDPKKPAAALWPDGSSVARINIVCPTVYIEGDLVVSGDITVGSKSPTPITLLEHKHPSAMGPTDVALPSVLVPDDGKGPVNALGDSNDYGAVEGKAPTVDLSERPYVYNDDGTVDTVPAIRSQDDDGHEVLIPTVSLDGQKLSDEEAREYAAYTGLTLGAYKSADDADRANKALQLQQKKNPPKNLLTEKVSGWPLSTDQSMSTDDGRNDGDSSTDPSQFVSKDDPTQTTTPITALNEPLRGIK